MTATWAFIQEHAADDVRQLALHKNRYPSIDINFALQQIAGRQLTLAKLPLWAQIKGWQYPVRLSLEQCSSQVTACYKKEIVSQLSNQKILADLTGGFGVDTFFLSDLFQTTHYVEQNEDLCEIARANFSLTKKNIIVHHDKADTFLQTLSNADVIFIDPARRDNAGRKVFRLSDCTPNLITLFPLLQQRCHFLLVKLSPMVDISQVVSEIEHYPICVHVVAVQGEVKEVLMLFDMANLACQSFSMVAANLLMDKQQVFTCKSHEEPENRSSFAEINTIQPGCFLYEPNAAIMKIGAFRLVGKRFGLQKLDADAHLYLSSSCNMSFPGRVLKIEHVCTPKTITKVLPHGSYANVMVRHYPQSPDEIKKRLHLIDGGTQFLIATSCQGKYILLLCTHA